MIDIGSIPMRRVVKKGGVVEGGEFEVVGVVVDGGWIRYKFGDGSVEDVVRLSYDVDSEETLKRDVVDYLYGVNEEKYASLGEGEAMYVYAARAPAAAEAAVEGMNGGKPFDDSASSQQEEEI